jgi:hypothetical protein
MGLYAGILLGGISIMLNSLFNWRTIRHKHLRAIGSSAIAARLGLVVLLGAVGAQADTTTSYVGTLASSESTFQTTLNLATAENVTLETYGFGGGVNGSGASIAAGGTDPFLAIFSGTGGGASILTDGLGNPYGTSLDLGNYGSFAGCPPAGLVNFGGPVCGDITMSIADLAAGTYTIVLSDGQYIANAVFDDGTLGEGFTDLTGGVFCNLANGSADCPNTSGAYALDVTTSGGGGGTTTTPEPATLFLLSAGAIAVGATQWCRDKLSLVQGHIKIF